MSRISRTQCALYQLGYSGQLLLAVAEDYWFAATPNSSFPAHHGNLIGEIQEQERVANENLLGDEGRHHVSECGNMVNLAWENYRQLWLNDRHRQIIEQREAFQDCDAVPDHEWWLESSPLEFSLFRQVYLSLQGIERGLSSDFAPCFSAGRLVAQVATLPFNQTEETSNRGERYPIAALRQRLVELRQEVNSVADLDVYFPATFSPIAGVSHSEYCKWIVNALHPQLISRLGGTSLSEATPRREQESGMTPNQEVDSLPSDQDTGESSDVDDLPSTNGLATEGAGSEAAQNHRPASDNTGSVSSPIREPSPNAIAAFRLSLVSGRTQEQVADELETQIGRLVPQGTVSRWLRQVRDFLSAGNVLPESLAMPNTRRTPREVSVDPSLLDLGQRHDSRRHRPSDLSDD